MNKKVPPHFLVGASLLLGGLCLMALVPGVTIALFKNFNLAFRTSNNMAGICLICCFFTLVLSGDYIRCSPFERLPHAHTSLWRVRIGTDSRR